MDDLQDCWSRTVMFDNVPADSFSDLWMFVNNRQFGGIESESFKEDPENKRVLVTFVDKNVTDKFLNKQTMTLFRQKLTISRPPQKLFKSLTDQNDDFLHVEQAVPEASGLSDEGNLPSIMVTNLPANMSQEKLILLLEHEKVDGAADCEVDSAKIVEDVSSSYAIVKLKDERVAEGLVDKGSIKFHNHQMNILKFEEDSAYSSLKKNKEPSLEMIPPKKQQFTSIKISGIESGMSPSLLKMYFENTKRSGGGAIQFMVAEEKKAIITFEESEAANRVVAKGIHELNSKQLKVTPLEPSLSSVSPFSSCALEVTGITPKHTKDLIKLSFEHRDHGGGKVEDVYVDYDRNLAILTFQSPDDVNQAIQMGPHRLAGMEVNVDMLEPLPPPKFITDPCDAKHFMAKRLSTHSKFRDFKRYVGSVSDLKSWRRLKSKDGVKVFLEFSSDPDYGNLRKLVCSKPFQGRMITIQKIPQTKVIEVSPINENTPEELLKYYFEGQQFGEGEVVDIQMKYDQGCAVVTFADTKAISSIMDQANQPHVLDEKTLIVKPFYPFLANCLPFEEELDSDRPFSDRSLSLSPLTLQHFDSTPDLQNPNPSLSEYPYDSIQSESSMMSSMTSRNSSRSRTRTVRTEKVTSLKRHQRMILCAKNFDKELMDSIKGLQVISSADEFVLSGYRESIEKAKSMIFETLTNLEKKRLTLPEVVVKLLHKEPVQKHLIEVCQTNGISISFGDDAAVIFGFNDKDTASAEDIIKCEILERKVFIKDFQAEIIKEYLSDVVRNFSDELVQSSIEQTGNVFIITGIGLDAEMATAEKNLMDLVKEVVEGKKTFDHPGIDKHFKSSLGKNALYGMQVKNHAIVRITLKQPTSVKTMLHSMSPIIGAASSGSRLSELQSCAARTTNGLRVTLSKEAIEVQQVDVIVNTTSVNLELNVGDVSKSILKSAGPEIQEECNRNKLPLKHGDICSTKAYRLPCRCVYHGAGKNRDSKDCIELLKILVKTALEKASRDNFTSIAFPAIGTGNLGIPSDQVATAMFEVVGDFSQSHPNATVKDVRFALKETKQPTFQAFQNVLQDLLKAGRLWKSPVNRQKQLVPYKVIVDINVYACSKSSLDNVFKEITESCEEIMITDGLQDSAENQQLLEFLTDEQVVLIENLQQKHSVQIFLEPPLSSTKLTVHGLAPDVLAAKRELSDILK